MLTRRSELGLVFRKSNYDPLYSSNEKPDDYFDDFDDYFDDSEGAIKHINQQPRK